SLESRSRLVDERATFRENRVTHEGRRISRRVVLDRRAAADELAVTEHAVEARDRQPELVVAHPGLRERSAGAAVGALPRVRHHDLGGVGRVLEQVALARGAAILDLADLLPDGDHRLDEAIELRARLAL